LNSILRARDKRFYETKPILKRYRHQSSIRAWKNRRERAHEKCLEPISKLLTGLDQL